MLDDNAARREMVLTGFVYEIQEGSWTNGIAISTGDEDYLVEMNEQGERLCKEIENDVRATGYVAEGRDGKNWILVTDYEVLPDIFESDSHSDLYDNEIEW
jgi:hypothetical protein